MALSRRSASRLFVRPLEPRLAPATFTVTNTNDDGSGSLRQAVVAANNAVGSDSIHFNLPGSGPHVISPLTPLPAVTSTVVIDGLTQPGSAGKPSVEIRGDKLGFSDGLVVTAANSTIRGLSITQFIGDAVLLSGPAANSNRLQGNYIGVRPDGSTPGGNVTGIVIHGGGSGNYLGTDSDGVNDAAEGNVVSGQSSYGIILANGISSGTVIAGNRVGTDASGKHAIGNGGGIRIESRVTNTTVGGTQPHAGNLISGNRWAGVTADGYDYSVRVYTWDKAAGGNGNTYVVSSTGTWDAVNAAAMKAGGHLLSIGSAAEHNFISSTVQGQNPGSYWIGLNDFANEGQFEWTDAASNPPSYSAWAPTEPNGGNGENTVLLTDNGSWADIAADYPIRSIMEFSTTPDVELIRAMLQPINNQIVNNIIGTDITGKIALPNEYGIYLTYQNETRIGGGEGSGNLISGNLVSGIIVFSSTGTRVQGNRIGTNLSGSASLPNGYQALEVTSATGVIIGADGIGPSDAGEGNLIVAGPQNPAVLLSGGGQHVVAGNFIGTDATGTLHLGGDGIFINGASGNRVGGTAPASRNVIAAFSHGLAINETADANTVQGNFIGTDVTGTKVIASMLHGVRLLSANNLVGGTAPGAGNLIAGCEREAVYIETPTARFNLVQGNFIGTDVSGMKPLGNKSDAILFGVGANNNLVGGSAPGAGNVISGNAGNGVRIAETYGLVSFGNVLQGNRIGVAADGVTPMGNGGGVEISNSPGNTVGGPGTGEANVIAFNNLHGVGIFGDPAVGNVVRGNSIHGNGAMAIELNYFGMEANDPLDADIGPNGLQNTPVLTRVISGGATRFIGSIDTTPNRVATIDFYASPGVSGVGGEGKRWLSSMIVLTGPTGTAAIDVAMPGVATAIGEQVTATATTADGTSEFSPAVTAGPARVKSVVVNNGDPQRSRVTSLRVEFDTKVSVADVTASLLQLNNVTTSVPVIAVANPYNLNSSMEVLFYFDPSLESGSLPDGRYMLTVFGDNLHDINGQLVDGDGDGLPGGSYEFNFHRLFGDIDGNAQVNTADFLAFRTAFGSNWMSPAHQYGFDADGNGSIDTADFLAFRTRFGTMLP